MAASRAKVIEVDFRARRRVRRGVGVAIDAVARRVFGGANDYVVFWRPPARKTAAEYLGGRWDWGWTLFVWTSDEAVGPVWSQLVSSRGYVPQRLAREAFVSFLRRASDIGGLLLDGELESGGEVIRAEPEQLISRDMALTALGG